MSVLLRRGYTHAWYASRYAVPHHCLRRQDREVVIAASAKLARSVRVATVGASSADASSPPLARLLFFLGGAGFACAWGQVLAEIHECWNDPNYGADDDGDDDE
eukprot:TRINITY_DN37_c0_g1_i1.p1 TRINITY_DN37_c0_g1~~TRINITY_DN37_c0_g1_i1.p1  ORF type:complete len:104 (+),score=24.29 TRINITY_DN37_c0_g1_i1:54-365(+)